MNSNMCMWWESYVDNKEFGVMVCECEWKIRIPYSSYPVSRSHTLSLALSLTHSHTYAHTQIRVPDSSSLLRGSANFWVFGNVWVRMKCGCVNVFGVRICACVHVCVCLCICMNTYCMSTYFLCKACGVCVRVCVCVRERASDRVCERETEYEE